MVFSVALHGLAWAGRFSILRDTLKCYSMTGHTVDRDGAQDYGMAIIYIVCAELCL